MNHLVKETQKGCGMLVVVTTLVIGSLFAVPPRFLGTTMIPEFIAIILIVVAVQLFSKRVAVARIPLAREALARRDFEEVRAVLEPFTRRTFIWTNARFDRTGEALWLLLQAYAAAGETARAKQLQSYLIQHRRGEFADKAKSWSP